MMEFRMPPTFLFLQTNQRCNLKCQHCDFWKLNDDDRSGYLTLPRRREVLKEFAELGGQVVVTCGGEPMLDIDAYFDLMKTARELKLRAFSVINGTRVHRSERAYQMVTEGPSEITVSLNSHIEAEHDRTRGVKGSFMVATRALRLMLAERQKLREATGNPSAGPRIYAMTIVHENNYREFDAFFDFVLNDLKADKLKLNILQPSFGVSGRDDFFACNQIKDTRDLIRVIDACDQKYSLNLNPFWKHQVAMYFDSYAAPGTRLHLGWRLPTETKEHICNTYDRNIMLDLQGVARLCFSHEFAGMQISKPGDLKDFWHNFSLKIRPKMLKCNRPCGISHSVRREAATVRNSDEQLVANRKMIVEDVLPTGFVPLQGVMRR